MGVIIAPEEASGSIPACIAFVANFIILYLLLFPKKYYSNLPKIVHKKRWGMIRKNKKRILLMMRFIDFLK